MPICHEQAGQFTIVGEPPQSATRVYVVHECQDDAQATALVLGKAPPTYRGLRIERPSIKAEHTGFATYTVEVPYARPPNGEPAQPGEPGEDDDDRIEYSYEISGVDTHITQCIEQTDYGPEAAPDIRVSRAIGVTEDDVEGVDIIVPRMEISVTRTWDADDLDGTDWQDWADLCGKVNSDNVFLDGAQYAPGELLYLGASGQNENGENGPKVRVTHRFLVSRNRQNFKVAENADPAKTITVASKDGHDYLWMLYKRDEADNRFVQTPDVAFVSKVYERAALNNEFGI